MHSRVCTLVLNWGTALAHLARLALSTSATLSSAGQEWRTSAGVDTWHDSRLQQLQ